MSADLTTTDRPVPAGSATAAVETAVEARPIPSVACCSPLQREPLGAEEAAGLAAVLKAVADPARLRLLSIIGSSAGNETCACDLTQPLGLSQPTVSHHLKTLVDAGLLTREKRGVWAYYSLVPGALDDLARVLTTR